MDVGVAGDDTDLTGADMPVPVGDFDGWVAARAADLLRFAYLMTGSQDAAEEALQSALTKACEHWSRVRRMADPDAYVRRMIVNAHVSWWRRFSRRESPVAEVRGVDPAGDPIASVSEVDAVWQLTASLPTRQRAAVVLRFYEDLSYREIAAVLQCPESTARSHIHRALAALRKQIEQREDDDE